MSGSEPPATTGGHDLRLVAPASAVWLAALVLVGCPAWAAYATAGLCAASALLLLRPRALAGRPPGAGTARRVLAGAALACAASSAAGVGLRLSAVGSGPVRELAVAEAPTTLEAVVTEDPRVSTVRGRELVALRVRAESVRVRGRVTAVRVPVLVLARTPQWRDLLPSRRVRFTARLVVPRPGELLAAVALVRGPPLEVGPPSAVQRAAEGVRAGLREAVSGLSPAPRGVLPGMVVGDTSRLDPRIAEAFTTSGLTHLMVVSGANIAIVTGAVLGLARWAGLSRRAAPLAAGAAVLAFVVVARPEPSVLRATVMGMIGLIALATGRERRGVPALCAAVLILVLADPALGRSYGFALSVLATAGLLVLAPPWRTRLRRWLPRGIADVLAMAAAAQVACTPVLVMLSGEIGLVAVAANLLAEPAVVPATLLGALAAAVAPVAMPVARLLVWPAGLAVSWIIWVARTAAAVPYANVGLPDGVPGAVVLMGAVVAAVVVVRHRRLLRLTAAAVAGVLTVLVVTAILTPGWPPRGWSLVACDVGQGDGLVLNAGEARAVVVDAGPDPRLMDGCLERLGVHTVALLVLTHPHADHVNGVPGVRHGRTVGAVLPSPLSEGEESRFLRGLGVRAAAPGQSWQAGPLTLSVLAPGPAGVKVSTRDDGTTVNNASVVLVARWAGGGDVPALSALLSGDVESEAQHDLAPRVPAVDVLKVPHHGSRRQDPGFLAATRARIAVASVGAGNDYGHPAGPTLALLGRLGMRVYRTDQAGDVAVLRTRTGPAVLTRGSPRH
ncbi:ComEC/Rec2 family competence protein [Actinomadura scrupuli]|uniref:ComEC/Rec2 family competence protein n=1 Tax=Actinomadura scrupuli TaxID=559629 RepID=UPI003D965042